MTSEDITRKTQEFSHSVTSMLCLNDGPNWKSKARALLKRLREFEMQVRRENGDAAWTGVSRGLNIRIERLKKRV